MKRTIGLIVAVVLVFTLAPSLAFAQETDAGVLEEFIPAEEPAAEELPAAPAEELDAEEQLPKPIELTPDTADPTEQIPIPIEPLPPAETPAFESQAGETGTAGFVERLYTVALNRPSDPTGKASWINQLQSRANTGAEVAHGFFFSEELLNRKLSDSEFLDICYRTFMNREADAGGKAAWQKILDDGGSRAGVFFGFTNSNEFTNICASYGIERGDASKYREPRDINMDATRFVGRLYKNFLGRTFDATGLNGWTSQLLEGKTGVDVASGFFYSPEAASLSTERLVDACYRAFLGREPDAAGKAAWLNSVNTVGYGKDYLFHGFTMSQEFAKICAAYNIAQGTAPTPNPPQTQIKIVIDPGHGVSGSGTDPGARVGSITEASLNRQLATKIVQQLVARGYKVYTTFQLVDGVPHLLAETPGTGIGMRVAAANAIGPNLFISVHHNSADINTAKGMLVLVDSDQGGVYAKSRALGNAVYKSIAELGYTVGNRKETVVNMAGRNRTDVLKGSIAPAITIEAGFITNPEDCAYAIDATHQQNLAVKVANGVDTFVAANNT
ncbi:MAG: DUF4214 domain-containing protein [Christensenellaceae bacterium]